MTTHCCQIKRIQKISKASERLKSRFHKLLAIAGLACAVSAISENHCTHLVLWRQGRASWSPTDSSPLRLSMRFEQFVSMAWSQGTRARRAERWRASAAKRLRAIRCFSSWCRLRMIMSCLHNAHHYVQNEETGNICIQIVQYRGVPVIT